MAKEIFRRSEKKFMLNSMQYQRLLPELLLHMERDGYTRDQGSYTICNLYFDTPDNYYIRQSLSGPRYKEKLRLRSYGTPRLDDVVYLELKKKLNGVVHKRRSGIVLSDLKPFLNGAPLRCPEETNPQVLEEIAAMLRARPAEPVLYLSYRRQALRAADGSGLRVTFDRDILTRRHDLRLEMGNYGHPLLREELWLMELKAEGGIPLWLTGLLSGLEVFPGGFSKYGAEYQRTLQDTLEKGGRKVCLKPSLTARLMPLSQSEERYLAS